MSPSRRQPDDAAPGAQPDVGAPLVRVVAAVLLVAAAVTGAVLADGRGLTSPGTPVASATATSGAAQDGTSGGPSGGTSAGTSGRPGGTQAGTPGAVSGSAAAPVRPDVGEDRVRALTALLAVRSRAMLARDEAGWLSTVDPSATAFRGRQATVFTNLRDVPLAEWSYRYGGVAPALPSARLRRLGPTAWVARVLVGHRIKGFDTATSYSEQFLTVVHRRRGWVLAADDDGVSAPQPWDLGRVRVERGRHVIVLGTGSTGSLRAYALDGDRAVEQVSRVWGDRWPRRAVLVAPRTQTEFGRLLLRERKGLAQVAAVTTGDLGPVDGGPGDHSGDPAGDPVGDPAGDPPGDPAGDPAGGSDLARNDRVVLNPAAFDRLSATGRRVVLTHEVTHVAVRSSTSSAVPIWLSEGFADYVAYKGSGVGRRTSAADVLTLVRAGRGPTTLPTAADFDPTRTTIAPSYSSSLLACDLLADTYGERGLVRLYRAATVRVPGAARDPEARLAGAFPRALGTSQQRFTAQWRRYLAQLAG